MEVVSPSRGSEEDSEWMGPGNHSFKYLKSARCFGDSTTETISDCIAVVCSL